MHVCHVDKVGNIFPQFSFQIVTINTINFGYAYDSRQSKTTFYKLPNYIYNVHGNILSHLFKSWIVIFYYLQFWGYDRFVNIKKKHSYTKRQTIFIAHNFDIQSFFCIRICSNLSLFFVWQVFGDSLYLSHYYYDRPIY